jgi:hypothetical protein
MSDTMIDDSIAADTIEGTSGIAQFIGKTERQVTHLIETNCLPVFKLGGRWHMRKSTYRGFIANLEAQTARLPTPREPRAT